jgi:hypothetical protein
MTQYFPLIILGLSLISTFITFLAGFIFYQVVGDIKELKTKDTDKESRIQKLESFQELKVTELIKKIDVVENNLEQLSKYVHENLHEKVDTIQQYNSMMMTIKLALDEGKLVIQK